MTWEAERVWVTGEEFPYSSSQVKKAGNRIRRAEERGEAPGEEDLRLLDLYRSSHYPALRHVQNRLERLLHKKRRLDPETSTITARPLKTREAIVAKLVRERGRLNRIQDIAGARIVVPGAAEQEAVLRIVTSLENLKPVVAKDSRKQADEQGYRAVHVVLTTAHPGIGERPAEIQIRTIAENAWAQVVENIDGVLGSDLKHGNGPADYQEWLLELSDALAAVERGEPYTIREMPPVIQSP
ncbi:MAG: RelA/SpoT domain-containing protein [Actinomycetota bacterium]|nr:RelA/SpoT domain-containing protein [Actinomycetota bacterium]